MMKLTKFLPDNNGIFNINNKKEESASSNSSSNKKSLFLYGRQSATAISSSIRTISSRRRNTRTSRSSLYAELDARSGVGVGSGVGNKVLGREHRDHRHCHRLVLFLIRMVMALLFVTGIFSLSALREGDLEDAHHLNNLHENSSPNVEDVDVNVDVNVNVNHMDNGWIPKADIVQYQQKQREKQMQKNNANSDTDADVQHQLINDDYHHQGTDTDTGTDMDMDQYQYEYHPSLNKYPLSLLQNITEPISPTDAILHFHIPKAAGTSTKQILSECFHLSRDLLKKGGNVNRNGNTRNGNGNGNDRDLDTSSIIGIYHAKQYLHKRNHRIEIGLPIDVITSSHLHEACTLLGYDDDSLNNHHHHHHNQNHELDEVNPMPTVGDAPKGRLFVMLRHPVEREISLFHYLGRATWEDGYRADFRNMTLEEYALSGNGNGADSNADADADASNGSSSTGSSNNNNTGKNGVRVDNWMTRYLARRPKGKIRSKDVALAKDVLRYKSLIGLMEDYVESMRRFDMFHGLHGARGGPGRGRSNSNANTNTNTNSGGGTGRKEAMDCVKRWTRQKLNVGQRDKDQPHPQIGTSNHREESSKEQQPPQYDETSKEWKALLKANSWDMDLYKFAKELYRQQGEMMMPKWEEENEKGTRVWHYHHSVA